ncbi:hypothetical protein EM20IM_07350 [Candidatus Methylacidiphilum infernorum]|uniref:Uncharacterized protein n=1 Tax=Candidatus Methylacidiphilum infernorum TaxID=511746 RepID=A0ABX7PUG9_9BACT|nr:hypothetical protein [Candidatus Methylacidiphilum infernorum]QSR86311.1 hypothetical protein EM20IM_07350 [Candidatus Methylacidiphilum infernorum]
MLDSNRLASALGLKEHFGIQVFFVSVDNRLNKVAFLEGKGSRRHIPSLKDHRKKAMAIL